MYRHVKGQPLIRITQHAGGQDQMGRAGDGQELGQALHDGKDEDL
jgi:hypothetical protein